MNFDDSVEIPFKKDCEMRKKTSQTSAKENEEVCNNDSYASSLKASSNANELFLAASGELVILFYC